MDCEKEGIKRTSFGKLSRGGTSRATFGSIIPVALTRSSPFHRPDRVLEGRGAAD